MSLKRLVGRTAIVTASTDGIGLAIARRLGQEGAKVIVSSRKAQNVEEATKKLQSEGISVSGLVCHVSKSSDRQKLFEEARKLGGLDILVSNAAVNPEVGGVLDPSWDKIFDTNVKSAFMLAKESLPLIRESKAGRIIFISSIGGMQPFNLLGAYSVSKTALLGLVKASAAQLASENITVNGICPGIVETKFAGAITQGPAKEVSLAAIPMGRFGAPAEIAASVAFLASDDGSWITGENLVVAGGMSSRL